MTKRDFLRFLVAAPVGMALAGCRDECCHHEHAKPTSTARTDVAANASGPRAESSAEASFARVDPGAPIDPRFAGCAMSCSAGLFVDKSHVKIQPGAALGDLAHCTVSGVVFRVTGASPRRDIGGGRSLFFCCESCAQYFSQHRDEVLAKRGILASET